MSAPGLDRLGTLARWDGPPPRYRWRVPLRTRDAQAYTHVEVSAIDEDDARFEAGRTCRMLDLPPVDWIGPPERLDG